MSYGITPFAVKLSEITAVVGSRNEDLLQDLTAEFQTRIAEVDEMSSDDDEPISMSLALRHLIMAEKQNDAYGYKYAYVLESLCIYFGEYLSNDNWFSMRWEWAETVDAALTQAGLDDAVFGICSHLLTRGAPVVIPDVDDFPAIGYLRIAEIPKAAAALATIRFSSIADEQVVQAIGEIQRWLAHCAQAGDDLVCFYY